LHSFGFTLLTSLSFNNRSRSKDLWVFTSVSQPIPTESQSSTPLGSRIDLQAPSADKPRERRRSYQTPTHSSTINNRPSHSRAATEGSIVLSSRNTSPSGPISSKSSLVRKPAPRAQLPVSVAHSNASNDNVHGGEIPPAKSDLRLELQSSVGSAEDMTGVGTQKYGRAGEPDTTLYHRVPSKFNSNSPGVPSSYYPSMSASLMKATQPSGLPRIAKSTGRTEMPSATREAVSSSIPLRSRQSSVKATSQPITPLLSPGAFRDSSSSNTGQTVDVPSTWPGAGREIGPSGSNTRSRDPKESLFPGGWIPPSAETKVPGDYPDEVDAHNHAPKSSLNSKPEEHEVKVSVPEIVHPRHRLARGGEATLVTEAPRADLPRTKGPDRLSPSPKSTLDRRDNDPHKPPAEGWVLVSVGQPSMTSAPQAPKPTSQHVLRRKQSFPPQKPPLSRSAYSNGPRAAPTPTGSPVGNGHTKASSDPPSSMSPAAKAIVIIDAMQAKRKPTSGDNPQSSFRKFFSLSRPGSPKSSNKEGRTTPSSLSLSSGGAKGKVVEDDSLKKRGGSRERWRVRGMPEVTKSNRRMSVD